MVTAQAASFCALKSPLTRTSMRDCSTLPNTGTAPDASTASVCGSLPVTMLPRVLSEGVITLSSPLSRSVTRLEMTPASTTHWILSLVPSVR